MSCTIDFQCETCGEYLSLEQDPRGSGITMLITPCECIANEEKKRAIKAEAKVKELESDVIMWRGRAMEMMGKFCCHSGSNPNGIMDRWDHHERTVKGQGHE